MPSERMEPLFNDDDEAILHWSGHAHGAWRTFMETGDPADLQDATIAAENYRAAKARLTNAE